MSQTFDIFVDVDESNVLHVTVGGKTYTKQLPAGMTKQEALDEFASELKKREWVQSLSTIQVGQS